MSTSRSDEKGLGVVWEERSDTNPTSLLVQMLAFQVKNLEKQLSSAQDKISKLESLLDIVELGIRDSVEVLCDNHLNRSMGRESDLPMDSPFFKKTCHMAQFRVGASINADAILSMRGDKQPVAEFICNALCHQISDLVWTKLCGAPERELAAQSARSRWAEKERDFS